MSAGRQPANNARRERLRKQNYKAMAKRKLDGSEPPASDLAQIDWQSELVKHDRWLRTVAYARLRDAACVDEVMQEVALAAVRQAAPLSDANKVAPWLYRLTVRQVLLLRRRMGRRRKLLDRYVQRCRPTDFDPHSPDPLAWLLADERRQMVRRALRKLSDRDAEILLLKYTENWNYHRIAEHLGISHSAVEARLHRARQRLRNELAQMQVVHAAID